MRTILIPAAVVLVLSVQAATQSPLPDAPGKALAEQVCGTCHGLDYLAPSTRTAAQWRDTMAVMKTSGAKASDEEWQTLNEYFMATLAFLNVNKATVDDVRLVFSVPEKVARAIVAERDKQGGFKALDDLRQFPDLDQKKLEAMKARLSF